MADRHLSIIPYSTAGLARMISHDDAIADHCRPSVVRQTVTIIFLDDVVIDRHRSGVADSSACAALNGEIRESDMGTPLHNLDDHVHASTIYDGRRNRRAGTRTDQLQVEADGEILEVGSRANSDRVP